MREFELCFDLEYRNRHLSLVPLRFGFERPKSFPWSNVKDARERRIEYKFEVTPPAGIMSRFIVKTHHMIAKSREMPKGVYWHNGVFVRVEDDNKDWRSEGLCEFDRERRILRFTVQAAYPQNMVGKLDGFLGSVFSFFEGLKPQLYYGCVKGEGEDEKQCRGLHSHWRVHSELDVGNEMFCEFEKHKVRPENLLFGIYRKVQISIDTLKDTVKEGVAGGIQQIGKDVMSLMVEVDKVALEINEIRQQGKDIPAKVGQKIEAELRNYLRILDIMLDNRDFNSAPAIVSIIPVDGSGFNPSNWFEKKYVLQPYCECEGGVHPIDFGVKFKMSRVWWEKTAPKLAFGMKILSAGVQIACSGLPVVNPGLFKAMKNEVGFMKELAGHLELKGGAESDLSAEAKQLYIPGLKVAKFKDLRQVGREDEQRIARMQLAQLFSEIAPKNYKTRRWGELRRVRMGDNTYRWLCEEHAKEYQI